MTGEQTTLVLGLMVFGLMVLLMSRGGSHKTVEAGRGKTSTQKSPRKKRK